MSHFDLPELQSEKIKRGLSLCQVLLSRIRTSTFQRVEDSTEWLTSEPKRVYSLIDIVFSQRIRSSQMASWKQLTDTSNLHVAVNMEQVCFMRQMPTYTELHFGTLVLPVKERASLIHETSGQAHQTSGQSYRTAA